MCSTMARHYSPGARLLFPKMKGLLPESTATTYLERVYHS